MQAVDRLLINVGLFSIYISTQHNIYYLKCARKDHLQHNIMLSWTCEIFDCGFKFISSIKQHFAASLTQFTLITCMIIREC